MKLTLLVVWLALSLFAARVGAADSDKNAGVDKLRGAWKVVSAKATTGGEENEDVTEYLGSVWTFGKEDLTIAKGRGKTELRYALDSTRTPPQIDLGKDLQGKNENRPYLGIYRLNGDRLTVCYTVFNVRPTDFSMGQGIAAVKHLVVLKRERGKQ